MEESEQEGKVDSNLDSLQSLRRDNHSLDRLPLACPAMLIKKGGRNL